MKKVRLEVCTTLFALSMGSARWMQAQTYTTGQVVYATPSGASNDWHSGCTVGTGRSNNSYQVACDGTTWWVSADHIRSSAPTPEPDPMRPGKMLTPVITSPQSAAPAASPRTAAPAALAHPATPATLAHPAAPAQTRARAVAPGNNAGGGYATTPQEVAGRIAQDKADAANAVLKSGKYSCYSGGQYTFTDLFIDGPHSYRVEPGGSGAYSYSKGALTFTSGPYAGAYSRMVDGKTVGVSAKGDTNLGTQCEFEGR